MKDAPLIHSGDTSQSHTSDYLEIERKQEKTFQHECPCPPREWSLNIHLLSCLVSFFYSIKFIVLELYCPWKWDKASPPPLTFKGKIKCSIFILSFWDLVQPGRIQNSKNNILSWMQSRARFSCITIDFANFLLTTFLNLILQIQLCLELYRKTIHAINTK